MNENLIFLEIANNLAMLSKCNNAKVAAIFTKNGRIICTGVNGTIPGGSNECECNGITRKEVIHAELNAIVFAAKKGINLNGTTLYVSLSPCIDCAKILISLGVEKVIYSHVYRNVEGLRLLQDFKINIEYVDIRRN